jgi:hypothetical protein
MLSGMMLPTAIREDVLAMLDEHCGRFRPRFRSGAEERGRGMTRFEHCQSPASALAPAARRQTTHYSELTANWGCDGRHRMITVSP